MVLAEIANWRMAGAWRSPLSAFVGGPLGWFMVSEFTIVKTQLQLKSLIRRVFFLTVDWLTPFRVTVISESNGVNISKSGLTKLKLSLPIFRNIYVHLIPKCSER